MPCMVVLVKYVPDSWSKRILTEDFTLDRENVDAVMDEINEFAVEQALRIKEAHPEEGWEVVALTVGPAGSDQAVRKAIAMGADRGVVVTDDAIAGSDVLATAWALNNAINTIDDVRLVLTGDASTDGKMGALPAVLSEYRQWPAVTSVKSLQLTDDTVQAERITHDGVWELQASLPAIVSVSEQADKARFPNFKGLMAAKKADVPTLSAADCGIDPATVGLAHAATAVTAATARAERSRGTVVHDSGDGAAQIVAFLKTEGFID
ncbi:electron transfer flavoprotein subunit beta/FixA family protein [Corynebacterium choanae]|nr:electron transfer flavoprotein subunit beta/FixA family protein [Corynebacterium choanae]